MFGPGAVSNWMPGAGSTSRGEAVLLNEAAPEFATEDVAAAAAAFAALMPSFSQVNTLSNPGVPSQSTPADLLVLPDTSIT